MAKGSDPVMSRPRRRPLAALFMAACLAALGACGGRSGNSTGGDKPGSPAEVPGPALFRDVTPASGVDFTYRNGQEADHYAILESLGGGVALLDYDGDGLLDIFIPGGGYFDGPEKKTIRGYPSKLYRNRGGWKFQDVRSEERRVGKEGRSW